MRWTAARALLPVVCVEEGRCSGDGDAERRSGSRAGPAEEPPDLALVVDVDAGTEARAPPPRRRRRPEPIEGAAR